MTRVLITGASGSLGSALARHLIDSGRDVVAMLPPGDGPGGLVNHIGRYEVRRADVRDPQALTAAMRGIDEVYHFAGIAITLNRLHALMEEVNVRGSANVAAAARAAGVRRLVHASSVAAVGYPPQGEIADEDFDIARSASCDSYLLTKRAGERELLRAWRSGGPEVVIVNLSAVIAPYSHRRYGWARLVASARKGQLTACLPGGAAMCSVEDMVYGMTAAMAQGRPGRRYIVASVNLSHRELFTLICRIVGVSGPRFTVPATVVRIAGRGGAVVAALRRDPMRSPLVVPENAELACNWLFYDTTRARRELGLNPTPLDASIAAVDRWLTQDEGDPGAAYRISTAS